jgi:transcriptional regulator with XRE-family HTH domain
VLDQGKERTRPPTEPLLRYDYRAFSVELGEKIKQLRKGSWLTLRNLIVQHDFHLTQIQRIERGEGISVPTLLRAAEVFQIPLEKLVEGVGLVQSTEPRSKSTKK